MEEAPVVRRPLVRELSDLITGNGSLLVASVTAIGFAVGAVFLVSLSAGLGGVSLTDLELDVRGYITVAVGALVYPVALLVISYAVPRVTRWGRPRRLERNVDGGLDLAGEPDGVAEFVRLLGVLAVLLVLYFPLPGLMTVTLFGTSMGVPVLVAFSLAAGGVLLVAALRTPRPTTLKNLLVVLVGLSLGVSAVGGHAWGRAVATGDHDDFLAPILLETVVPVTRGVITLGDGDSACVDRVGSSVIVGRDATAVITSWERFIVVDCERGNLATIFTEVP